MSAAVAEPVLRLPEIRQRSWASFAIVAIDILALELALLLGCIVRFLLHSIFPIGLNAPQYQGLALGVLTLPLAYAWVGVYPGYGTGVVQRIRARVYATLTVFIVLLAWNYAFQDRQWSRGVLLLTMVFALALIPAVEAPVRKMMIARGICGVPVIILGGGRTGAALARALRKESDLGFVPAGILDDDPRKWGAEIEGVPIIGPLSMASAVSARAKTAIVAMPGLDRERLAGLVHNLTFPNVIVIPDLFGIQSLWITSRDLGGVLALEVKKNLLVESNRVLKRLLDFAIAVPGALLSAPLIATSALWIKVVSRGPAFFIQEREGMGGKRITVYKLRTMHPDAERILLDYLAKNPEERERWYGSTS